MRVTLDVRNIFCAQTINLKPQAWLPLDIMPQRLASSPRLEAGPRFVDTCKEHIKIGMPIENYEITFVSMKEMKCVQLCANFSTLQLGF